MAGEQGTEWVKLELVSRGQGGFGLVEGRKEGRAEQGACYRRGAPGAHWMGV